MQMDAPFAPGWRFQYVFGKNKKQTDTRTRYYLYKRQKAREEDQYGRGCTYMYVPEQAKFGARTKKQQDYLQFL